MPFDGELIVLARWVESEGIVSLELGLPTGEQLPAWEPGAHVDLVLPNGLTRQYSLCGQVGDRKRWRVGVLREPESRGGSTYVHDHLEEGATLRVRGPRNNFPLLSSPKYVFIGGGIGVTPLLPMIHKAQENGADWVLHYGGRSRASMAFRQELECYGERVRCYPQDEVGLPDLDQVLGTPAESTLVYCCGPAGLIDAVEVRCQRWAKGSLHVERFSASGPAAETDDGPIEVELRASGKTITVPAEMSILEAVENEAISVISSCAEGICGSCETAVLDGEIDHRDQLLTDDERAAMDTMMICVSRAKCGRLVLDL
ncbi:MAG TPA: PDR/VanB family oxidoreductase [Amycolatopsis sp.]|nr:PDR/VanB family oxidoreductase [Amycolatopsis sp.]